jgi:predicted Rossmann-fold nucleotide-binding protein
MSRDLKAIALFCGSNTGRGEAYREGAARLGAEIGRRGLTLVYGGTHKGLMGVVADAVMAQGGAVHGVITRRLADLGHLHEGLTRHEIVDGMRARKERMAELADGFVAMPGGIGTLEIEGYYQPFMGFIDHMIAQGFLPPAHRQGIVVDPDPARLIDGLAAFERVTVPKWL